MTAKDPTAVFNELMALIDHPMVVVTTAAGHARAGCLVGFHCQCGMEPPLYAVWLSKANHTYRIGALEQALTHIMRHKGVWAATGSEILDAWTAGQA